MLVRLIQPSLGSVLLGPTAASWLRLPATARLMGSSREQEGTATSTEEKRPTHPGAREDLPPGKVVDPISGEVVTRSNSTKTIPERVQEGVSQFVKESADTMFNYGVNNPGQPEVKEKLKESKVY